MSPYFVCARGSTASECEGQMTFRPPCTNELRWSYCSLDTLLTEKALMALKFMAGLWLCMAVHLSAAVAQPVVKKGVLVTKDGFSLYVFDNDIAGSGQSVCNQPCSNVFPPYVAGAKDSAKGDMSLINRQDGSKQWAYKGRPLYRFYADDRPGQQGGDGINRNLWHIARK